MVGIVSASKQLTRIPLHVISALDDSDCAKTAFESLLASVLVAQCESREREEQMLLNRL